MNLLSIEEIVDFIGLEFKGIEPELIEDLLLNHATVDLTEIDRVKATLSVSSLPLNFTDIIIHYDFSNFTILNIGFGGKKENNLNWLIKINILTDPLGLLEDYTEKFRTQNLIFIANGDPFTILLDIISGNIYTIDNGILFPAQMKIADSFSLFIQKLGTAFYSIRNQKTDEFLELLKNDFPRINTVFWEHVLL